MVYLEAMAGLVLEKWRTLSDAKLLAGRLLVVAVMCLVSFNANGQSAGDASLTIELDELGADSQAIMVTLRNTASTPVAFLPWGTPFGDVDGDVLQIRDSKVLSSLNYELVYNGLLLKRGDSRAHNFIILKAGETLTKRITPADHYAIDIASTYLIRYRGDITYTRALDVLADKASAVKHGLSSISLVSNEVGISLEVPPEVRAAVAPAFAACSVAQQAELQSALLAAETIARNASLWMFARWYICVRQPRQTV